MEDLFFFSLFLIHFMYELNCVETDRTGPSLQKIKAIPELRNNTGYGSFNTINKNFFCATDQHTKKNI